MQVTSKVSRVNDHYQIECVICGEVFKKPVSKFIYKSGFIQYAAKGGWSWHQINNDWSWVCPDEECVEIATNEDRHHEVKK
jgi:hypothetical protein